MLWFTLALCLVLFWAVLGFAALYTADKSSKMSALAERVKSLSREEFRFWFEVVGIAVALVTVLLLFQQNLNQATQFRDSFQQQSTTSAEEVAAIREQIQAQSTESARQIEVQATTSAAQYQQQQQIYINTRRAELLETIYGRRDCESEDIEECPFVSSVRVRAESVKAFTELEWEVGVRPNLSWVDLSGADLRRTDFLSGTILSKAILSGTVLIQANLSGADLSGADLSGANLHAANLLNADLRFANLIDTDLFNTALCNANLTRANLSGAYLGHADLAYAGLKNAILFGTNLTNVNLVNATLQEATLVGADLRNADLRYASLVDANLADASMGSAILDNAEYSDVTYWPEGFDPKAAGAIEIGLIGSEWKPIEDNVGGLDAEDTLPRSGRREPGPCSRSGRDDEVAVDPLPVD